MKRTRRQFISGAIVEVVPAGVRGGDFVLNILGAREGGADRVRWLLIKGWIRDPFGQHALLLLERIDPRRQRLQLVLFPVGEFLALGRSAKASRPISRSIVGRHNGRVAVTSRTRGRRGVRGARGSRGARGFSRALLFAIVGRQVALPQPIFVAADVLLHPAGAFAHDRAGADGTEALAIVRDEQPRAGPVG